MGRVFPVGATPHTGLRTVVLTLLALLAATSRGAANDDLTLPPPTYPEVVRHLAEGDPAAALRTLDTAAPAGPDLPLEAMVLHATLLAHVGRAADAEAVEQEAETADA